MFAEFRRAWREAVDNFWRELEAGEASDDKSRAVFREVATARNQLAALDAEIGECRQREEHERAQVEACARRERLATGIGDVDTARIAAEYRVRHEERAAVLGRKLEALRAERELCRRDLEEMERALQNGRVQAAREHLEDLDRHPSEGAFRDLEDGAKVRSAEERLAELKKKMGR